MSMYGRGKPRPSKIVIASILCILLTLICSFWRATSDARIVSSSMPHRRSGFAMCVPPHLPTVFIVEHRTWLQSLLGSDAHSVSYEFTAIRDLPPTLTRELKLYSERVHIFVGEQLILRTGRVVDKFEGYYCKLLALSICSLDDIIWLDFDVFLLQDPRKLFRTREYVDTGTLLFRESLVRRGTHGEPEDTPEKRWAAIKRAVQLVREDESISHLLTTEQKFIRLASESPMGTMNSFVATESSLILFNRTVVSEALKLLLALADAVMRVSPMSGGREYLDFMHGDCEFFWVALALSGLRFAFSQWTCSYAWTSTHSPCLQAQLVPNEPSRLLYINQVKDLDAFTAARSAVCNGETQYGKERRFSDDVMSPGARCVHDNNTSTLRAHIKCA